MVQKKKPSRNMYHIQDVCESIKTKVKMTPTTRPHNNSKFGAPRCGSPPPMSGALSRLGRGPHYPSPGLREPPHWSSCSLVPQSTLRSATRVIFFLIKKLLFLYQSSAFISFLHPSLDQAFCYIPSEYMSSLYSHVH